MNFTVLDWNGEFVEVSKVLEEVRHNKFVYWHLKLKTDLGIEKEWVVRRQINNYLPVIADCLKPLFRIPQTGCLTTKVRGKLYILLRSFDPHITPEVTLYDCYKNNRTSYDMRIMAQNIYCYRHMLGMSSSNDSNLVVRMKNGRYIVYSFIDNFSRDLSTYTQQESLYSSLNQTIIRRWFTDNFDNIVEIETIIKRLIPDENQFRDKTNFIIDKALEIIKSIDSELIWYHGLIVDFLINKLI